MADVTGYDEALAEALAEDEEAGELRERLRSGGATGDDRRAARDRLGDQERHVFELAHPSPPAESAQELDGGEIEVERMALKDKGAWKERSRQIRERLTEALDEGQPVESLVTLRFRVSAPEDR